jgi:type VI protein secretion system component VasK
MARQSRSDRWQSAVNAAREALERMRESGQDLNLDELESAASDFENAMQDLADVKQEYQDWYDSMPEGLQQGATGEKLEAISYIDVENVTVCMDDIQSAIQAAVEDLLTEASDVLDEAEDAELPVGFGRD